MIDHERFRETIGAYALGALPEDERAELERHMATCHDCRREADELRVVVAQLPDSVERVQPPAALRSRIMTIVEAEARDRAAAEHARARSENRSRWSALLRPRAALVAACVLLVAGIAGGIAVTGDSSPGRWDADVVMADASAELEMAEDGATLAVRGMPQPKTGRVYQVWLQRGSGAPEPTQALFSVDPSGNATVEVDAPMEGVDAVLVTDEPKGGSRAPTRSPVIVARPA